MFQFTPHRSCRFPLNENRDADASYPEAMANSSSGDSMLGRIVRVLSAFDPEHPDLTLASLAARAGLPASTAYRIVDEMIDHDLLHRDPAGRIRVGVGMWELANRASDTMSMGRIARPHMLAVNTWIGEHVQLAIMRESDVLFLERVSAPQAGPNIAHVGGRLPTHASASGLILLAQQPEHVRESYLHRDLARMTASTITDPTELREVLGEARRTGFATLPGHMVASSTSYAVPVAGPTGEVVAALGAVVDTESALPDQRIHEALAAGARAIRLALHEAQRAEAAD